VSDIELDLKNRLRESFGAAPVVSAAEVQALLDRCDDYRKRLRERKHEHDKETAQLKSDLANYRQTLTWARQRLDPEEKKTGFSVLDTYEVSILIEEIEKRRGRVVAMRLLYGSPMDEAVAQETLGVLKHAIAEARADQARWRKYLADAKQ
jgi:hypothetical protein